MSSLLNFLLNHTPFFYLTQSLWRDEAFSYFMAQPSVFGIIKNTANDFNPPLYYLLLHFWSLIVGKSDELLRILSLLPHLASVYIAYYFAKKIFSEKFGFYVAALMFFNPMLLYYAFELRMYSFYALFALAALYFFHLKKWRYYTVFAVLGLYTHTFFLMIPVALSLFVKLSQKHRSINELKKTLFPLIFFVPWLPVVAGQFLRSGNSWMFPVDLQLVRSVLGNLFTGYEGTPGNLWQYTALLSLLIIVFTFVNYRKHRKDVLLFAIPVFLPLLLILIYSLMARPIYVNRYLIFVSIYEVFLVAGGIYRLNNRYMRLAAMAGWLVFCIVFNIVIPPLRAKTDFKSTFAEINSLATDSDYVYAKTPIGFLESAYYYKNAENVFVYNPQGTSIPNYIGMTVVFTDASKSAFPDPPSRTFLVADDASYEAVLSQ